LDDLLLFVELAELARETREARAATAGQVDDVNRKATAQENSLIALASVGRGLPDPSGSAVRARARVRQGKALRQGKPLTGRGQLAMTVATSGGDEQYFQKSAAATAIGRLGEPVDIANTVAWLCSEEAAFVTGAVIDVNGGSTMQ
jgi:enoyl-ACP reductase-like protein